MRRPILPRLGLCGSQGTGQNFFIRVYEDRLSRALKLTGKAGHTIIKKLGHGLGAAYQAAVRLGKCLHQIETLVQFSKTR
jgi:hypothetical protein